MKSGRGGEERRQGWGGAGRVKEGGGACMGDENEESGTQKQRIGGNVNGRANENGGEASKRNGHGCRNA